MRVMDWQSTITELTVAGLTQREISERTGISQGSISELGNGAKKTLTWELGEALRKLHRRVCKAKRKPADQPAKEG